MPIQEFILLCLGFPQVARPPPGQAAQGGHRGAGARTPRPVPYHLTSVMAGGFLFFKVAETLTFGRSNIPRIILHQKTNNQSSITKHFITDLYGSRHAPVFVYFFGWGLVQVDDSPTGVIFFSWQNYISLAFFVRNLSMCFDPLFIKDCGGGVPFAPFVCSVCVVSRIGTHQFYNLFFPKNVKTSYLYCNSLRYF